MPNNRKIKKFRGTTYSANWQGRHANLREILLCATDINYASSRAKKKPVQLFINGVLIHQGNVELKAVQCPNEKRKYGFSKTISIPRGNYGSPFTRIK